MEILTDFLHTFTTAEGLREFVRAGEVVAYVVLFIIIFSETGLLVGFFLPGDSLLVVAGLLASSGDLNIFYLIGLLIPAAIIGDAVGYNIGLRGGRRLMNRPNSRFFKKEHLVKTQEFYQKHGGKTIVLARYIPIIRTFAPVVAGMAQMPYRTFGLYNIGGGILWILSTTLLGFYLGRLVPNIDRYLHFVIGIVIFLSILPPIIEFVKHRRRKGKAVADAAGE
ncbi:MAG: VTT domain-containing protein [Chlorobi bacterium]|nr:MAG: DedA family protein [Chlorobi bacterium OLB7]MBK8910427.1 VTT domain-containing protein [Chlorobiota bacterium]